MGELLKLLTAQGSATTLAALAIGATLFALREYLSYSLKLKKARLEFGSERNGDAHVPPPSNDPKDVVHSNFALLEKYYEQTLGEYRLNARASVVIACLGFAVILVGVGLVFSGLLTVGVISGLAGLVAEGATALFFRQNHVLIKQVEEYHKKLVSTQYLLTAISLSLGLGGPAQENEVRRIILNLLYLSNELHGAKSAHLTDAHVEAPDNGFKVLSTSTPVSSGATAGQLGGRPSPTEKTEQSLLPS